MSSILIDQSNILYRGYYAFPNHPCGEVYYTLTTIKSFLTNPNNIVYLCLDGKPSGGLIDADYKANRDHGEVFVYRYLPHLVSLLKGLRRVHIAYNPNLEADEVIFSLTRILDGNKLILSTDNDLLQALKGDTEIQRGDLIINEKYYKEEMISKFHAVSPERLPIYRAIVGDTSDNLRPPVPRFPKELAAIIAGNIVYKGDIPSKDSLHETLSYLENLTDSKKNKLALLLENYNKFKSNFEIMRLTIHKDLGYTYPHEDVSVIDFPSDIQYQYRAIVSLDAI